MMIRLPQLNLEFEFTDQDRGANLLAFLSRKKIPIPRSCGGDGVCATCRVHLSGDAVPIISNEEKKLKNLHKIQDDPQTPIRIACLVSLPNDSKDSSKMWEIRCRTW